MTGQLRPFRSFIDFVPTMPRSMAPRFVVAFDSQFRPRITRTDIVISPDEMNIKIRVPRSPFAKLIFHHGYPPKIRVEKVAQDDQYFRLCLVQQTVETRTVFHCRLFRHRKPHLSKRRRLAKMRIGDEESRSGRPIHRPVRTQHQFFFVPGYRQH